MKNLSFKIVSAFFFIASLIISLPSMAAASTENSLAPILEHVLPSIVNIKAQIKVTDVAALQELMRQKRNSQNNTDQAIPSDFTSVASGVIVDANKGYILTNAHVVNDAQTIVITLSDGRHFPAKTIGLDKGSDIALLQITAKGLTAIQLANSNDLKVGDFVAAIGNPFGLNQTVTSGIISALGRTTLGIESYENFIQTDAPINPGNSGGALVNMQGQLIGLNTAILAPDRGSIGIGFAVPANMAKSVMLQLIEFGNVKRGLLGIGAQDVTPELANAFGSGTTKGAAVTQVLQHSPAQQAGIQVGDIITAISNVAVKNASDVVNTVGFLRVDSKTNLELLRQGKKITVNVTLLDDSKRKESIEKLDPYLYGVGLKDFTLLSPINVMGRIKPVKVQKLANLADVRMPRKLAMVNNQKAEIVMPAIKNLF